MVYNVSLMHFCFQWITCEVSNLVNGCSFVITFVYGLNIFMGCQTLWDYLLGHVIAFLSRPWLILRDFNDIMSTSNKCGGDLTWHRHLNNFGNYVHATKLVKVPYSGLRYTWHNGQHSRGTIIEKLDWIFGNSCWLSTWPTTCFKILPRDFLYQSAMVIQFSCPLSKVKTTFKFLTLWANRDDFLGLVAYT
jgi:hypothetical protein